MYLIADSGSSKTSWRGVKDSGEVISFETLGINPLFMTDEVVVNTISEGIPLAMDETVTQVYFYGAGVVNDEQKERLTRCLRTLFPSAECEICSDLLAAARALCGRGAGIACIIGTGSNSSLYDGSRITQNTRSGGYILGDEGGGAYLGKRLLSDYIKGLLPQELSDAFDAKYALTYADIVKRVYNQPLPQRFIASFSEFIAAHRGQRYIEDLLQGCFTDFITRNVLKYGREELPVHFVGSVAYHYRDVLEKVVAQCGLKMGVILKDPADALVEYHHNS